MKDSTKTHTSKQYIWALLVGLGGMIFLGMANGAVSVSSEVKIILPI